MDSPRAGPGYWEALTLWLSLQFQGRRDWGGQASNCKKMNRKRGAVGVEGRGHPSKKLLSPLEGGGGPGAVGRESEEEKRRVPATSPASPPVTGEESEAGTTGAPLPEPHPVLAGASRPGVRTRVGLQAACPDLPCARGLGLWGGSQSGPSPVVPPTLPPGLQICVSCTFSLEPLLKSRGSWMELRPGGPLPPQPPPLGLLL